MFLFNIYYDKATNSISGDKISMPEGSGSKSRIVLTADIDAAYSVYIDFAAPKGVKFRSEKMTAANGKYELAVPAALSANAGNAEIQLVFVGADSVEKSLVNSGILYIAPSINAVEDAGSVSATVIDDVIQDNIRQDDKLVQISAALSECEAWALADKFVTEIVYDMSSASAEINRGFPSGLYKGSRINNLNLSKYRFLIIDCQFDRNVTLFMNLTEINRPNNFYISSAAGSTERQKTHGTISFEVIVDLKKTYIHLNNTVRSQSYTTPSILVNDSSAYISKVTGII